MRQLRVAGILPLIFSLGLLSCGGGGGQDGQTTPDTLSSTNSSAVAGDSGEAQDAPQPGAKDPNAATQANGETTATDSAVTTAPKAAVQELTLGPNGRFFSNADGSPFFWVSDTQWEIIHKSTREQAQEVLADRQTKGFTAIQIPLLFYWSIGSPTLYGELPGGPDNWNEAYWEYADYIIDATIAHQMHPIVFPAWGNLSGGEDNLFTAEEAYRYGQWVATRYKDRPGVVFIAGGDRGPATDCCGITEAIAKGIKSVSPNRLVSFHALYRKRNEGYTDANWVDFSTYQTSHNKCTDAEEYSEVTATMLEDWEATPQRPIINIEPRYEDIGDGGTCGYAFTPYQARISAYWSVFAGSAGIGYSKSPLWYWAQWGDNQPDFDFNRIRELLNAEFGAQLQYLKALMLSRPFFSRVPDPALAGNVNGVGATRGDGYIMVYAGQGQTIQVDTTSLSGNTVQAWWFNPRDGSVIQANNFIGGATESFDPPGLEEAGNDWVLVLDDQARGFPRPGKY